MAPLPSQRWQTYGPQPEAVTAISDATKLLPLVAQVLANRDIITAEAASTFLEPETEPLEDPLEVFPPLAESLDVLETAITNGDKIAICGDYDADGMTSTALLLRALRYLGGNVDYAIPSRMNEGYGINDRIVEDFHADGVRLLITVDNGIAAVEPIALARKLGINVIITDHHELPEVLPPANAILNPKQIPQDSGYAGMAGVGMAYIVATSLAAQMGRLDEFTNPLLELFTLGTIADMAPLVGINRRWLKRGLARLPQSQIPGIQALIEASGVNTSNKSLKPDDIGFRLGPRINAIGRIGDPEVIIELLITDDLEVAREKAEVCEATNQERRRLCEEIEAEAIAQCEQLDLSTGHTRALLLLKANWHHGVIGIVASRLVERYGMPVFISTYEDRDHIRGSARGIPEFDVFEALQHCDEVFEKYGGHKAAGGFSLKIENFERFQQLLQEFAKQQLEPEHLKPLVKLDSEANLSDIGFELYEQIDGLNPWGIGNTEPVFWSRNVEVKEQRIVGQGHIKLKLSQEDVDGGQTDIGGIVWRWGDYYPLPRQVDVAYKLKENTWKNDTKIEVEVVGMRHSAAGQAELGSQQDMVKQILANARGAQEMQAQALKPPVPKFPPIPKTGPRPAKVSEASAPPLTPQPVPAVVAQHYAEKVDVDLSGAGSQKAAFEFGDRPYSCQLKALEGDRKELLIRNDRGEVLAIEQGQANGLLGKSREEAKIVDVRRPRFKELIKSALAALEQS